MWSLFAITRAAMPATLDVPVQLPTVAAAVAAASPGDTVRIDALSGPYTETVTVDRTVTIEGLNGRPVLHPLVADEGFFKVNDAASTVVRIGEIAAV